MGGFAALLAHVIYTFINNDCSCTSVPFCDAMIALHLIKIKSLRDNDFMLQLDKHDNSFDMKTAQLTNRKPSKNYMLYVFTKLSRLWSYVQKYLGTQFSRYSGVFDKAYSYLIWSTASGYQPILHVDFMTRNHFRATGPLRREYKFTRWTFGALRKFESQNLILYKFVWYFLLSFCVLQCIKVCVL